MIAANITAAASWYYKAVVVKVVGDRGGHV
jgi:hypothetical protein